MPSPSAQEALCIFAFIPFFFSFWCLVFLSAFIPFIFSYPFFFLLLSLLPSIPLVFLLWSLFFFLLLSLTVLDLFVSLRSLLVIVFYVSPQSTLFFSRLSFWSLSHPWSPPYFYWWLFSLCLWCFPSLPLISSFSTLDPLFDIFMPCFSAVDPSFLIFLSAPPFFVSLLPLMLPGSFRSWSFSSPWYFRALVFSYLDFLFH